MTPEKHGERQFRMFDNLRKKEVSKDELEQLILILLIEIPHSWTSHSFIIAPLISALRSNNGQWSALVITSVAGNFLSRITEYLDGKSDWLTKNTILDSNTVAKVAPDQGVGKSVEKILGC